MLKYLLPAALGASFGAPATAAVIGFDGLPLSNIATDFPTYSEDDFIITFTAVLKGIDPAFGERGKVHLDDSGTSFVRKLTITAPFAFDVFAFELSPFSSAHGYFETTDFVVVGFENVLLEATSIDGTDMRRSFDFLVQNGTIDLGDDFRRLQSFSIGFTEVPPFLFGAATPDMPGCDNAPCTHFLVDDIVAARSAPAVIPLPATATLGSFGLLVLAGLSSLRRHREG